MSENTKSAWGNGDEAEKAAAEVKLEPGVETELEKNVKPPRNFAEMLQAMAKAARDGREDATLTPEQQISRLKSFAQRYHEPAHRRFEVGDVVTTSANTYIKEPGVPAIVLEIRAPHDDEETINTAKYPGSSEVEPGAGSYGLLFDMRVLKIHGEGEVYPMWVESWTQEKWKAPADKAA